MDLVFPTPAKILLATSERMDPSNGGTSRCTQHILAMETNPLNVTEKSTSVDQLSLPSVETSQLKSDMSLGCSGLSTTLVLESALTETCERDSLLASSELNEDLNFLVHPPLGWPLYWMEQRPSGIELPMSESSFSAAFELAAISRASYAISCIRLWRNVLTHLNQLSSWPSSLPTNDEMLDQSEQQNTPLNLVLKPSEWNAIWPNSNADKQEIIEATESTKVTTYKQNQRHSGSPCKPASPPFLSSIQDAAAHHLERACGPSDTCSNTHPFLSSFLTPSDNVDSVRRLSAESTSSPSTTVSPMGEKSISLHSPSSNSDHPFSIPVASTVGQRGVYTCSHCGRGFSKAYNRTIHERTHTDERPFRCNVCDRRFRRKDHLRDHSYTHLTSKPFVCTICNRGFCQSRSLENHRRTNHSSGTLNSLVTSIRPSNV